MQEKSFVVIKGTDTVIYQNSLDFGFFVHRIPQLLVITTLTTTLEHDIKMSHPVSGKPCGWFEPCEIRHLTQPLWFCTEVHFNLFNQFYWPLNLSIKNKFMVSLRGDSATSWKLVIIFQIQFQIYVVVWSYGQNRCGSWLVNTVLALISARKCKVVPTEEYSLDFVKLGHICSVVTASVEQIARKWVGWWDSYCSHTEWYHSSHLTLSNKVAWKFLHDCLFCGSVLQLNPQMANSRTV